MPDGRVSYVLLYEEAQKYNIPLDNVAALVEGESGGIPTAQNAGHYGLLQMTPDYAEGTQWHPGGDWTTAQLFDPQFNLDQGLAPWASAYHDAQSQGMSGQAAFDYANTHSGHDYWTGQYSSAQVQQYMDTEYAQRQHILSSYQGNVSTSGIDLPPVPNPLGVPNPLDIAGSFKDFIANGIQKTKDAYTMAAMFYRATDWIMRNPGYALVFTLALIIVMAAAFHMFAAGSKTVITLTPEGREFAAATRAAGVERVRSTAPSMALQRRTERIKADTEKRRQARKKAVAP